MDAFKRVKMIRAMDLIVRSLNDEEKIEYWLQEGVADGDGDEDDKYLFESYGDDKDFQNLMNVFCETMQDALEDGIEGTLYFDCLTNRRVL